MPLIPDPCFIETIRKKSGPKRVLVYIASGNPDNRTYTIENVDKPDWVDVEKAMISDQLLIKKGTKLPLVVNINTDHRDFPDDPSAQEQIVFDFDNGEQLTIFLYLQEIVSTIEHFRGTFSIDFGTTNTCYAYKGRVGDDYQMVDALKPPSVSREIPTLVRFLDISNPDQPKVAIGHDARDYIARNSSKSFTFCISIKRLIGSDKDVIILDDRSGLEAGRYRQYKPYQIAGFILRELIQQAENEIGQQIDQVVATFPILYNRQKLDNLRAAFQVAFEGLGRSWSEDQLILRIDETNAATFNYVYGQLLDEFRRFTVQRSDYRLVSYDFGGGTVDVAVTDVDLARDPQSGRISITTKAKGLTGDSYFGGDNITLATLQVLKSKLLVRIAERRQRQIQEQKSAEAAASAQAEAAADPWAIPTVGAQEAPTGDDPWGALAAEKQAAEEAAAQVGHTEEVEDPETADIVNMASEAQIERSIETLVQHQDVLAQAVLWGVGPDQALERMVANGVKTDIQAFEVNECARALVEAADTLLPTAWKKLEDAGDLIAKDVARKLFYELWLPAEIMKIRSVTSQDRRAELTEPLRKVAKYAGVRPEDLMGITVSEAEINAAIEVPLRRSLSKAAHLMRTVEGSAAAAGGATGGGLDFGFGASPAATAEQRREVVLLAGNSSRLPIVRSMAMEIFSKDEQNVVMDPNGVKATVAQGACEEHILRRDFGGEGGLIQYTAGDFIDNIAYTIGLFQKELSLVGYRGGFAPVMPRGTPVGSQVLVSDSLPIIHAQATELSMFGWYHDHEIGADEGAPGHVADVQPRNLGWFDLTSPEPQTFDEPFVPSVASEWEALGTEHFAFVLLLDGDQSLRLVNPRSKQVYHLRTAAELCLDADNPFSGVH